MNENRVECTLLWFIENYCYSLHKVGERLESPCFTVSELENTTWRIGVYPRGKKDDLDGYISLFLFRSAEDEGPENIFLNYEISVLATDGSLIHSGMQNYTFAKSRGYGWPKFTRMVFVSQDILTVRCRIWKGEGQVHKLAPICARTRIAVERITFLHVVENFSTLEPNQKKTVESESESNKIFVSSHLYFNHDSCDEKIIVEFTPSDTNYTLCKRKVSLIDASGHIIVCGANDNRCDVERKNIQKLTLTLTRQVILNNKFEYLPDDKLSMLCECVFSIKQEFYQIEEIHSNASIKEVSNPISCKSNEILTKTSGYPTLSEDMKALYLNRHLTDVELTTKTKTFPAHKVVLCARSPVFDVMMTNDMKERCNNCIKINDLGDDIVQHMLLFLYSDTAENLQWENATQLYYAGDKYQIDKLKTICSAFLVENLTASNVSELLILADTHNDSDLRSSVEGFIFEHEKEVFGSKEWEIFIDTYPSLASKTMHLKYKREN